MSMGPRSPGSAPGEDPGGEPGAHEPPDFGEECENPAAWDAEWEAMDAQVALIEAGRAADTEFLTREDTAELAAVTAAAGVGNQGRRGPDLPGSARLVPGESASSAGGFGAGQCLDVAPGGSALHGFAESAVDTGTLGGATEDEILGLIAAADRAEAAAAYLKHAAAAELIRRRPAPGYALRGPARMPGQHLASAGDEVRWALAENRYAADSILALAHDLEVNLPGTREAFRSGMLRQSKAEIIARATRVLDPAEARAAEAMVLGQAGTLSPGGLRVAIARAVMEVAPDKARKRRERAARDARVERWPEDSGNAALAGRELPPADVLAADQRISSWARQLKAAGLPGDMDALRARAFLDLLLDQDSRPARPGDPAAPSSSPPSPVPSQSAPAPPPSPVRPSPAPSSPVPSGFAGRVHLTVPLATLLDLTGRPGEFPGLGPVDPALARELADAAARNPTTIWCLTVTDGQGHAIGHGCARPEPRSHASDQTGRHRGGRPDGRDPPGFAFASAGAEGPPGGYGTWRFTTGVPGQRALRIEIDPIATGPCDHRFQAGGHDPGVKLRHLAQIRYATCTAPMCRRPSTHADFEHNIPYETGGKTCLCNGGPKCRHDHRLKQDPRWKVDQRPDGTFVWTTPAGRQYTTGPACYPV